MIQIKTIPKKTVEKHFANAKSIIEIIFDAQFYGVKERTKQSKF